MRLCPPETTRFSVPRALEWMIRLSPAHAWICVLLCLDLAVMGDILTGTSLWFGPAYLIVMCLTAWCLGWRWGFLVGLGCTLLTFAVNGVTLYPNGEIDILQNLVSRIISISLVLAVVAGSRRAYLREWWLARSDPLTGAFNRKAFFELASGMAQSKTWRILLYADLDGFKRINDEHGHAAGDHALQSYADVVRRNIRSDDLFARVGGDEFLIFMQIRDPQFAASITNRLYGQMNNIPQIHGGVSRCSLGALIIPPGAQQIDHLVRQADAIMYRAKVNGGSLEVGGAEPIAEAATGRGRKTPRNYLGGAQPRQAGPNLPSWMHAAFGYRSDSAAPLATRRRKEDPAW